MQRPMELLSRSFHAPTQRLGLPNGGSHVWGGRQMLALKLRAAARARQRIPSVVATVTERESVQQKENRSSLEYLEAMKKEMLTDNLDLQRILQVAQLDLETLTAAASEVRDRGPYPNIISFSPKVFIPLTRACRDACAYCTFALAPRPDQKIYMSIEEVLDIARNGAALGCTEALFTLGDKPELLYPRAKEELAALGHGTTISYVAEVAKIVLEETGLLPHVNAGVLSRAELALLRKVSVSQGLMLETISERLLKPGGAHHRCPDKVPASRLATIAAAGEEKVPFTSGLLVGIGETREERIESLLELRKLHKEHGHIQELIIQNFCAKKGTRMEFAAEPSLEELQWTIAVARLIFGSAMNIQAPPNLTPRDSRSDGEQWIALMNSGINDWGGISPLTKDWVNPEAPWPHISFLAAATAKAGKDLVPRLGIYPQYIQKSSNWLDPNLTSWVLRNSNSLGYARGEAWSPGIGFSKEYFGELFCTDSSIRKTSTVGWSEYVPENPPFSDASISVGIDGTMTPRGGIFVSVDETKFIRRTPLSKDLNHLLERVMTGAALEQVDIVELFQCMGEDFRRICQAADQLRSMVNGGKVSYVVNRNINYTNVCSYKCQFCAFSKGKANDALRGKPYNLPLDEIARRVREAWDRGATEVCMQGGIHPEFTGETYLKILHCVKEAVPNIHVHAFSPLEVYQGAKTLGISVGEFLQELKRAGLGSLPGTAAEILDSEVRDILCPDKLNTEEWLEVMRTAHAIGLRSTSTIMFGHIDGPHHWANHLLRLRELQKETGGFTEFVPLPFVHMEAPLYLRGKSRQGPTRRECILMHAVARLVLHPYITNIQASWVKMGPSGARALLMAGCNDMGGTLMNESITRAAGASHGEELPPGEMEALIHAVGRIPEQRTTIYGVPMYEQVHKSFIAAPLQALH